MKFLKHMSAMFDKQKILLLWQQNKQIFHMLSLLDPHLVLCSRDLNVLHEQKLFYFTVIAHTSAKVRKTNRMATCSKNHYLSISFTEWKIIPPWYEFAEN